MKHLPSKIYLPSGDPNNNHNNNTQCLFYYMGKTEIYSLYNILTSLFEYKFFNTKFNALQLIFSLVATTTLVWLRQPGKYNHLM